MMRKHSDRYDRAPQSRAFSLVELSIVLVILGLLVGGVLSGQSLIRASELRSVTTQHSKYLVATSAFRDKYFYFPGDMPNATQFWGLADAGSCSSTLSTDARTCDGDGNGLVEPSAGSALEIYRFWQHLANAGLIEGIYSGTGFSGGMSIDFTVTPPTLPAGKFNNGYYAISSNRGIMSASPNIFAGDYGNNSFMYGAAQFWFSEAPLMSPGDLC